MREAARRDQKQKFTAWLHHVTVDLLRDSYYSLKRQAAPGVDGVTWQQYGEGVEARLQDLHERVHRGAYRAQPSRRTYIPKADGRQRPLGIAALEDKIVQQAVVTVLHEIYEEDFLGFSYGFRPGRKQHDALDALAVGLRRKKVNWILDLDAGYFNDHAIPGNFRALQTFRREVRARVAGGAPASQSTASPSVGAIPLDPGSLLTPAADSASGTWSAV